MKLTIFGLSISSSWGNGHATLWRGLCRALIARGHDVHFFERDVPYYAGHRDLFEIPGGSLHLYREWDEVLHSARMHVRDSDVTMVTSYCPDALAAGDLCLASPALNTFYDLDTGVTLERLAQGLPVDYIGPSGLRDYDLVLSYVGGRALEDLRTQLGARMAIPIYGSVDPAVHHAVNAVERFAADLCYLGTYAEDRQQALERLLLEPARMMPDMCFRIAGAMYPENFPWSQNICFDWHLPPAEHPAFYCSSRLTLNITRHAMAVNGYCPSGRFFEAAACGVPILTDQWEGLDYFFKPGREIIEARDSNDAVNALLRDDSELRRIGLAARERCLAEHTADVRAREMEAAFESARSTRQLSAAEV